jgi:hypothetical protein
LRVSTNGTTNPIVFYTGGGVSEAVRIDSSQNVGIGTSSPSVKLTIKQSLAYDGIRILSNNATTQNLLALYHNDTTAFVETTYLGSGSYTNLAINSQGGNVGIGTSSPNTRLHIAETSDVAFTLSNSSSVTSGNRGTITMANSSNSTVGIIRFGAVTDNVGTNIQFYTRPAAGSLTQSMTLSSAGNLGVGTTNPAVYGGSAFVKTVNISSLNNVSAGFSDDVTGTLRIAHASNQIIFNFDTTALCFQSNGPSTPTERVRITEFGIGLGGATPSSGMGITFPATQSASSNANTLDDYEEGTWTPSISASSGSYTSTATFGTYVKIGKSVTIKMRAEIVTNGTAAGAMFLGGIPFPAADAKDFAGGTREDIGTGNGFVCSGQSTTALFINKADGTYGLNNGNGLTFCIAYIAAT